MKNYLISDPIGDIAGSAYEGRTYYKQMPDALVYQALKKLPEWMVEVSERFDEIVNTSVFANSTVHLP